MLDSCMHSSNALGSRPGTEVNSFTCLLRIQSQADAICYVDEQLNLSEAARVRGQQSESLGRRP